MHSTTYRRQAKKLELSLALERRVNEAVKVGDHYTEEDRKVAEQLEAAELFRAFLAEEL